MPHIVVKLWPGETEESKRRLADEITKAVKRTLGYGPDSVSVALEEIASGEWTEKVYNTEILPNSTSFTRSLVMRPSVMTTMERETRILRFCAGCLILCTPILPLVAAAQQAPPFPTLRYDGHMQGPVPIPASERSLETITAERWFTVSDQPMVLEGPAFDRTGALIFSDVYGGRILRLTPDRHLSTIATHKGLGNGGLAIHKDGRIFAACVGDLRGNGSIVAMNADGSHFQTIFPQVPASFPTILCSTCRAASTSATFTAHRWTRQAVFTTLPRTFAL